MTENPLLGRVEQKEFPNLTVEILSVGKIKKEPSLNEDRWVAREDTFAVIDGSSFRLPIPQLDEQSGGQFAAGIIKRILETTNPTINGARMVELINQHYNRVVDDLGIRDMINESGQARPSAVFSAVRMVGEKVHITALGDVGVRVNGVIIHQETFITEEEMIQKRIQAMQQAKSQNPALTDEKLIETGRKSIEKDLAEQPIYFNDPDSPLGLGLINGNPVPDKFIKTYEFPLKNMETLELFSDGYYVLPEGRTISAWEETFHTTEAQDPLHWQKYPSIKFSTADQFSDDRTIVIVRWSTDYTSKV